MPGLAFHITARVQAREPLFLGCEHAIERIIVDGIRTSDATRLSHVVMPNHFHLVIRQGTRPLGWVMQPIMRRIALFVKRSRDAQDHIFGGRFFSAPMETADYSRAAIVYTNINPQRARICADPVEYVHSSHRWLATPSGDESTFGELRYILELFADEPGMHIDELRAAYLAHVRWRLEKDAHDEFGIPFDVACPPTRAGDRHFSSRFVALPPRPRKPAMDLRDKAIDLLEGIDRSVRIDQLKVRTLPRFLAHVRWQLIARLLQAGYSGSRIADFLRISESAVSKVAVQLRYAAIS